MAFDARREQPVRIGHYQIVDLIGRGGMAEVFLGRAPKSEGSPEWVAIKRIFPHLEAEEQFVRMFIDEARIAARLHHPSIARIYDFGIAFSRVEGGSDSIFIVMEYVPGVDLRAIYGFCRQQEVHCSPAMAAFVVARICAGLECAHTKRGPHGTSLGIIHRDVSPSNVLATFEGEVKLIDFGVAKAAQRVQDTTCGGLKGKVPYMSPEQALGGTVDRRSDIFSAGTLLYELLTGINPFRGDEEMDTLRRVQTAAVNPPSKVLALVPGDVEEICLRALARRPQDRYATAGEMATALDAHCSRRDYGSPQLGEWMQQCFPAERERAQGMRSGPQDPGSESHEAQETNRAERPAFSAEMTSPILANWAQEPSPTTWQRAQRTRSMAREEEEKEPQEPREGNEGLRSVFSSEMTTPGFVEARRDIAPPQVPEAGAQPLDDQSPAPGATLGGRGVMWIVGAALVVAAGATVGFLSFRGGPAESGSGRQVRGDTPPAEPQRAPRPDSGSPSPSAAARPAGDARTGPELGLVAADGEHARTVRWPHRPTLDTRKPPRPAVKAPSHLRNRVPRPSVAPPHPPSEDQAPGRGTKAPRKSETVPL
jgi:serine/threonine-protein kinase